MALQNAFNQSLHENHFESGIIVAASAKIRELDNSIVMLRELRKVASNKQLFENFSRGDKQFGSKSHEDNAGDDNVYPPVPDHSLYSESTAGERFDSFTLPIM